MSNSFIRVPPDSTGKKVAVRELTDLYYKNQSNAIVVGDTIVGSVSGATGVATAVIKDDAIPTSGEIYMKDVTGVFEDNENFTANAVTAAQVNLTAGDQTALMHQKVLLTDVDNPNLSQRIDRFGAACTTYTDGAPTLSPFGALTVGERQTIKDYSFPYDNMDSDFYTEVNGSGMALHEADSGTSLLQVGSGAGHSVTRTSNFYHPYAPGVGQAIVMTVRCSDQGKAGLTRRWGYFDDNNGVFWQLEGTQLSVVLRSNVTGSVQDIVVLQQNFSNDRLDGSDSIGFNLDVDMPNIYSIDMQWLGTGRIRFSVSEPQGSSVTAHVMENANVNNVFPYMRTATLPVRYEQINTGSTGSTSEMRIACITVKHSSAAKIVGPKYANDTGIVPLSDTDGEKLIVSYRPTLSIDGVINRGLLRFVSASYGNISLTGNQSIIFRVYAGVSAALTGAVFTPVNSRSVAESDVSATAMAVPLIQVLTVIVGPNNSVYQQSNIDAEVHTMEIYNHADNVTQQSLTCTAELTGTGTALVAIGVSWEEILA